jgi:RAB protein geranylgeranyltransferase component A
LYTNYGTGDIAQGFARISAVCGSSFVLNNFIEVTGFIYKRLTKFYQMRMDLRYLEIFVNKV